MQLTRRQSRQGLCMVVSLAVCVVCVRKRERATSNSIDHTYSHIDAKSLFFGLCSFKSISASSTVRAV